MNQKVEGNYHRKKKKKKQHDKVVLLGKPKLDTIEFPISKTLIDSYTGHEELVLANNVLKKSSN